MKFEDLKPGMMLEGPKWNKPVTLELFTQQPNDRIRLMFRRGGGRIESILIRHAELDHMQAHYTPHGIPWRVKAAVDMLRHRHAQSGMVGQGEMDPLPHQIQSIYHITGQHGDVRFLLADEPGAGKTAVAASIIHEMQLQGRADRTLIVVPAHLKGQWRAELERFAGLKSFIVEGGSVDKTDPWPSDIHAILITSMDYAKTKNNHTTLKHKRFDLVVVDEAHHMNSSGRNVSVRYKLGETLSKISTHLLFLTATPHRGKPENFRLLLKLLDEMQFTGSLTPEEVAARKTPFFMRHLKHEMTDMDGKQIFTKRHIRSLEYMMSRPEKTMYDMVSNYVRTQHQLLADMGERLAPFVLLLIQKRMASSTYALQKTLERRRERLKDRLDGKRPDAYTAEEPDDEDDPEHEQWDDMLSGISAARTTEELEAEIAQLDGLVDAANQTATTKPDKKLEKLLEIVNNLGDNKLLIFSEFVDTIQYLETNLKGQTCRIDGNMKQDQRDTAVQEFRDKYSIMLATDAAREGINLQFCSIMVNYDLPWSPIVLEQRMGRLHRYGQKKDVMIHNMVAADTIEGDVLERLSDKVTEIQKQYTSVDVIGSILSEVDINIIMRESIMGRRVTGIDQHVSQAKEQLEFAQKMLENTPVDRDAARRKQDEILAKHVDGEYLKRMMQTIFEGLGGKFTPSKLGVPNELRTRGIFRNKWVALDGPVELAMARGTKYFKHMEDWVMDNCMSDLRGGSVFAGDSPGHIVFHTAELKNMAGETVEVLVQAHHTDMSGTTQTIHPDILYTLEEVGGDPGEKPDTNLITGMANDEAQNRADYKNSEMREFWDRRIKIASGASDLEKWKLERGEFGIGTPEHDELDRRIRQFEKSQQNMQERAEADQLYVEEPRMMGWVKIIPHETQDTEGRGMNRSMEMERKAGWEPEDVSKKRGIGYDILSRHTDGRERHIEVKARCSLTGVQLTPSEEKARLNDSNYIVHVHVINGDTHSTTMIDNPADVKTKKKIVYDIPKSEIDRHGVVYEPT